MNNRKNLTQKVAILALAFIGVFSALGAHACTCAIGEISPTNQTVAICEEWILVEASAPITCDGVGTGMATGTNAVPHIPGEESPGSVPITVSGICSHGTGLSKSGSIKIDYDKACSSESCDMPTADTSEVKSMHWKVPLGKTAQGKSSGQLGFVSDQEPDATFSTPGALALYGARDLDIVRDGPTGHLRQIMASECFATIATENEYRYSLSFYVPGSVEPEFDTNGWYVLKSGATPFVHYLVENPDTTNGFRRLQITKTLGGEGLMTEFSWERNTQDRLNWFLSKGGGLQEVGLCVESNGLDVIKTWTTRTQEGVAAAVQSKHYTALGDQQLLTRIVDDPDGAARTTLISYVTDTNTCNYGKISSRVNPDGSWLSYGFHPSGVISERRSGWLDADTNAAEEATQATVYDYAPFLSVVETNTYATIATNDHVVATNYTVTIMTNLWPDTGTTDFGTPRVETVIAAGVPVAKTLRVIYTDTMGYKSVEEVRLADPSTTNHAAAYADPANPRTVRTYMPKSDDSLWSERTETVRHPDGRAENTTYVLGDYAPGDADAPGSFTENAIGTCLCVTLTHGTTNAPDGIAYRTTREVAFETLVGRTLQSETHLYDGSDYERVAWRKNTLNDLGQTVATYSSDGSQTETTWGCCGPAFETAADGTTTTTTYDALQRPILSDRDGEDHNLYTETAYDAAGRATYRRTFAGDLAQSTTNVYDLTGRLTWSRGPDGIETHYSYGSNATTTIRGALTNLSVRFADGRAHYSEQNGLRQQTYAYGLDASSPGCQTTTVFSGPDGADSSAWSKTVSDPLGRTIAQIRPGFPSGAGVPPALLVTSNFYDTASHLVRSERWTLGVGCSLLDVQIYTYDSLGQPLLTCQDLDLDGEIDLSGPDRVSGRSTRTIQLADDYWHESASWTYPASGSAIPLTNAISRTRFTGLGSSYAADGASGILSAESVSIDHLGNQTTARTVLDRDNKTVYRLTDTPHSTVAALSTTVNGRLVSSRSTSGLVTSYTYDALGRQIATQDARGGIHSRSYDALGRVAWETDPATNGTWFAYDSLGRRIAVTNALGQVTHTEYDAEGRVIKTWGATYPVAYGYDAFGRMVSMKTFRDEQGAGDETRWFYEEATGLLTNKVYADGKGTAYSYTADGKLASRAWARGVTTEYNYAGSGELSGIDYSDDTPEVSFAYDRLGRMTSAIVAGISTNAYTYDSKTLALIMETQNGMEITRTTDALGRDTGFSISGADYGIQYGYDTFGRFSSVTSSVFSAFFAANYSYLPDTDLISGMTASSGFLWTRAYESARSLITSVENSFGETIISRYDYANDALGRRTSRADSGLAFANPAFDAYSYNVRSEVTGAQRYHGTDVADTSTVYGGRQFGYAYDPIGNRTSASETIGGETLAKTYTANALNQYTAIANPDAVGLRGDATNTAVVTVNSETVQHDAIVADTVPWHFALEADNANGPDFPRAEIVAVINPPDTNTPALVSTATGCVYAPPQSETLTYDADGNLTSDGRWQYTWNGENRLIKAEELVSPTNRQPYVVKYAYDHQGRMVWKTVSPSNAPPSRTIRYLWDDYNIIAEHVISDTGTDITYNVWGLDLSGSLQGAGGVGGLLAVVKDGVTFTPVFDGNGNVTKYLSEEGAIVAHREYDPFGSTVVYTSAATNQQTEILFTHWFSTKPWCAVTGLSEYETRKYSPSMGRWLSRDPIGEGGGALLYNMCENNSLGVADYLGLASISGSPTSSLIVFPNDPAMYILLPKDTPNQKNSISSLETADATQKKKWKFPKPKVDCGGLVTDCCSKSGCMLDVHERGNQCRKNGPAGCFYFCAAACVFSTGGYIPCLATCWTYCELSFLAGCSAGEAVCVALCATCPNP